MTIRARVTLWFAGVLFASLLAMAALSYYELVAEPRREALRPAASKEKEAENEEVSDILAILAWCGLPALGLALGGGWWLMRKAFAPVAALTSAAERINEHNLGERLPRTGEGDELDRLTEVFNDMTERLHHSFQRIREFTLHASHELKTPLTVMHGELETALREPGLASEQRERLESELDEVQRLTKIVDGLTLLTRADAGQISLARETVRLDELLLEACGDAQSLARTNEIEVSIGACEELTVMGDRHRLRQLLLNLTDNAVKYNARKGTITLSLRRAGDSAEIAITNTGKGISPAMLPRIFDPFFRGDSSHSHEVEGCGLGLSIARWIVSAHGGSIQIASTPNQLTTATVRLPLAQS
jgi:two-component system, OmpR family, heavy metal sensor histidine kinase CusS